MGEGGRRILAGLALVILASGCRARRPTPPACSPAVFGVAEYDALLEPTPPLATSPLFATDAEALDRSGALAEWLPRLDSAVAASPDGLPPRARVALQNDAWGLNQRLARVPVSSATVARARAATARLVGRLALEAPAEVAASPRRRPGGLPDGWSALPERTSALPSMQHERLYGMRRLFRVFVDGPRRALVSQLVALDSAGRPYLTRVVGEVEALRFEGETLAQARVLHLDRRGLRCGEPLHEVEALDRIPAKGAHGFLLKLPESVPVRSLPCKQCHRSLQTMSLPDDPGPPAARIERLLRELGHDETLLPGTRS